MKLQDILQSKGSHVHQIAPTATLADVVAKLMKCKCGSLVVMDGEQLAGIITERDILAACDSSDGPLDALTVESRMTADVISAHPKDTVDAVMGLLTEKRIRHLPVLEEDRLVGLISIGDVVKAHYNQLTAENHHLKMYIQS